VLGGYTEDIEKGGNGSLSPAKITTQKTKRIEREYLSIRFFFIKNHGYLYPFLAISLSPVCYAEYMEQQEYRKNFDGWNVLKQNLEGRDPVLFEQGDIRWCHLGVNIGHEQDGGGKTFARPVFVYKKINHATCIIIPLTTRKPRSNEFAIQIHKKVAVFIIHQIRLIDARRLNMKIGKLDDISYTNIQKAVYKIL